MQTATPKVATARQIAFIQRLQTERGLPITEGPEIARAASRYIDELLAMPRPTDEPVRREAPDSDLRPGVYEKDGVAYIVKPTRADKARLYAKRVVEIGGTRSTEAGTFVAVEFEYDRGAIFRLSSEDRMTGDRAKALTLRYGRCVCCGRDLKAGESVEQGIGPKCVLNFPELVEERKEIKSRARAEAREGRKQADLERDDAEGQRALEEGLEEDGQRVPHRGEPLPRTSQPKDTPVDLVALARQIEGEPVGEPDEANAPSLGDESEEIIADYLAFDAAKRWMDGSLAAPEEPEGDDAAPATFAAPTPYSVLLAVNEPDVAVTARWSVLAFSDEEAVRKALDLAEERFGGHGAWQVESVEVSR